MRDGQFGCAGSYGWGRPQWLLVPHGYATTAFRQLLLSKKVSFLVRLGWQLVLLCMHRETLTFGEQMRCSYLPSSV